MEIKNLEKAAERILKAIKDKENIILYGDADPDGVGSVVILKETLEELRAEHIFIYFPDREKEGYGINEKALNTLKKHSPALFIALDCGIGNVKEVELAKEIGFEVIIIDHHKPLPETPQASLICDPRQKGDEYPFKELATVAIVYKLSKLLFSLVGKNYRPERFLELVALATISDLMPLEDENEKLVREGLLALGFTKREGLKALIKINNLKDVDLQEVRRKVISPLNAGLAKDHSNETYLLLIEKDPKEAKKKAKKAIERLKERRESIKMITGKVKERIEDSQEIIFEGDKEWPLVFLGPVASRICQEYKKPTFLYQKGSSESVGAVRMPKGLDAVKAMISCRELLKTYGGHPPAAGFRIKNESLEEFKNCLIKYF
jgi:single-stranded-DNA-specific exonuclease